MHQTVEQHFFFLFLILKVKFKYEFCMFVIISSSLDFVPFKQRMMQIFVMKTSRLHASPPQTKVCVCVQRLYEISSNLQLKTVYYDHIT